VLSSIQTLDAAEHDLGNYTEYEGREGLQKLADGVKLRGRKILAGEGSEL
jgi:hypothetical protein